MSTNKDKKVKQLPISSGREAVKLYWEHVVNDKELMSDRLDELLENLDELEYLKYMSGIYAYDFFRLTELEMIHYSTKARELLIDSMRVVQLFSMASIAKVADESLPQLMTQTQYEDAMEEHKHNILTELVSFLQTIHVQLEAHIGEEIFIDYPLEEIEELFIDYPEALGAVLSELLKKLKAPENPLEPLELTHSQAQKITHQELLAHSIGAIGSTDYLSSLYEKTQALHAVVALKQSIYQKVKLKKSRREKLISILEQIIETKEMTAQHMKQLELFYFTPERLVNAGLSMWQTQLEVITAYAHPYAGAFTRDTIAIVNPPDYKQYLLDEQGYYRDRTQLALTQLTASKYVMSMLEPIVYANQNKQIEDNLNLIEEAYSSLLAMDLMFKKIGDFIGINLSNYCKKWLEGLAIAIETYNQAIRQAQAMSKALSMDTPDMYQPISAYRTIDIKTLQPAKHIQRQIRVNMSTYLGNNWESSSEIELTGGFMHRVVTSRAFKEDILGNKEQREEHIDNG